MIRIVAAGLICLLLGGCACPFGGPSDEDRIAKLLDDWRAAVMAKDIDGVMALYADSYQSAQHSGKEAVRVYLQRMFEHGQLDDAEVDLALAKIEMRDGTAIASGVALRAEFGAAGMVLGLVKDGRVWRIDSMHAVPY